MIGQIRYIRNRSFKCNANAVHNIDRFAAYLRKTVAKLNNFSIAPLRTVYRLAPPITDIKTTARCDSAHAWSRHNVTHETPDIVPVEDVILQINLWSRRFDRSFSTLTARGGVYFDIDHRALSSSRRAELIAAFISPIIHSSACDSDEMTSFPIGIVWVGQKHCPWRLDAAVWWCVARFNRVFIQITRPRSEACTLLLLLSNFKLEGWGE